MTPPFLACLCCMLLSLLLPSRITWEIKTNNSSAGDVPFLHAIISSLEESTGVAFYSAIYCTDEDIFILDEVYRLVCESHLGGGGGLLKKTKTTWKMRKGFEGDDEWQITTREMEHRNGSVDTHQERSRVSITGLRRSVGVGEGDSTMLLLSAEEQQQEGDAAELLMTPTGSVKLLNEISSGFLQSGKATHHPLWDIGIHGEGQIVAIRDSALDVNSCFFKDSNPDTNLVIVPGVVNNFPNHTKVVQYAALRLKGNVEPGVGGLLHGTHVAGSVAGFPVGDTVLDPDVSASHKGVAYMAKIAFTSLGQGILGHEGVSDFPGYFDIAYNTGARIHTNSYGIIGTSNGEADARDIDQYMHEHQDFLVVFAAGNTGRAGSGSLNAPSGFKNGLTVGSSENRIGGSDQLSVFSSRGPTYDGRIKPDVIAPGQGVVSAQHGSGGASTCDVHALDGTSMAAGVLSGTAALVRQYFTDGYYPDGVKKLGGGFIPMAALLKAVVVNSASRMTGFHATAQGDTFPSMDQGFGLVNVANVLVTPDSPPGLVTRVYGAWSPNCTSCPTIVNAHPGSAERHDFVIAATTNGLPLAVTLAWSDVGARPNANKALINDLDLTLEERVSVGSPIKYYPNALNGPDRLNTVERITINQPVPGATYHLQVTGFSISKGPQPYAVVITGPLLCGLNRKSDGERCAPGGTGDTGGTELDSCDDCTEGYAAERLCGPECVPGSDADADIQEGLGKDSEGGGGSSKSTWWWDITAGGWGEKGRYVWVSVESVGGVVTLAITIILWLVLKY